jgi:hypothetical protein
MTQQVTYQVIELSKLRPSPYNPRKNKPELIALGLDPHTP